MKRKAHVLKRLASLAAGAKDCLDALVRLCRDVLSRHEDKVAVSISCVCILCFFVSSVLEYTNFVIRTGSLLRSSCYRILCYLPRQPFFSLIF